MDEYVVGRRGFGELDGDFIVETLVVVRLQMIIAGLGGGYFAAGLTEGFQNIIATIARWNCLCRSSAELTVLRTYLKPPGERVSQRPLILQYSTRT